MKTKRAKAKIKNTVAAGAKKDEQGSLENNRPTAEAFLDDAKNEAKRTLLMDHILTIQTLRDEKRFTFRGIAEWLQKKGIETDHSAVYRVYLAAIPDDTRHPNEDWSEVDEPDFGDEPA